MRRVNSLIFAILLAVVMLGVIFGILTDSRNSILVKEMVYVAGAAVAALLAGVLLVKGTHCHWRRIPPQALGALVLIIAYAFIRHLTGIGSVNGPFTLMMLLSLSVITVTALLFMEEREVKLLARTFLISSSVLFAYAVMQWQGVNLFQWDAALTRSGRSTGSLGNPNLLGGFASAVIPLGIAVILTMKKGSTLLKYSAVVLYTVLTVLAVVASGTRGSLLGLSTGCIIMAVWYIRKKKVPLKTAIPVLLFSALVIAIAAVPMSSRLSELDPGAEDQGTLQVRKLIWSGALAVFSDSPVLGHGPGSFQILYPEHRNPDYSLLGVSHNTLHAHCEYLEILVDLGIIGLLLWGFLVFSLMGRIKEAGPLRAAAFAGLAAMLAEAAVSVHLRWPPTAWLFSFLAIIYLATLGEREKPGSWRIPAGVLLIVCSAVLSWGFFTHYLPASASSRYVFLGKDVYLSKTEATMQNAYSAALQWQNSGDERALNAALSTWSSAEAYSDSSVHFSLIATETYPQDLGGWYALGSAYLTRYMVMQPPVSAMREALAVSGMSREYTAEELRNELLLGMAAYDSLVSMAPNYAEVHNNLALGYSNLSMVDEALVELYRAYLLHGHRREDYTEQAYSLLPLSGGSIAGCAIVFSQTVRSTDLMSEGQRMDAQMENIRASVSFIYSYLPEEKDSLENLLNEIVLATVPEAQTGQLIEIIENTEPGWLFSWYYSDDLGSLDSGDMLHLSLMSHVHSAYNGKCFPCQLPSDRGFYTFPYDILVEEEFSEDAFNQVLDVLVRQIVIDRNLDGVYTLALSDRFAGSVDQLIISDLNLVREAVGGSRTALRNGGSLPWLEGSLASLLSHNLQSLQEEDSLNSRWYEMEFEVAFLVLSSYWWDYQIFSSTQNQYLLDRTFFCRDRIRELNPESWQYTISSLTERTSARTSTFTGRDCLPPLQQLASDLVDGTDRFAMPIP